ncbi:hypothetical protein [Hydrogenivirga sp.]
MRYLLTVLTVAILGLLVGGGSASYLTYSKVMRAVGSIPASPIVVQAEYDREKHQMHYSIMNPGTVPLTVVEKSIVFTPGSKSGEKEYVLADIPADVTLPPGTVTIVTFKLKPKSEKLKLGDVVVVTFAYKHPLSRDIYTVVHPFTYGKESTKKEEKR